MDRDYDPIDEAYAIFARTGPEFGGGLSNHGPMAAEALAAMRRPDAIAKWAHRYAKRLEPHPSPSARISEDDWREALGNEKRVGDWIAFFDDALKDAPWREVLDRWTMRLAPGIAAAAFHGVLRTAHAARALGDRENSVRVHELAEGLGYWAATFQALPGKLDGAQDALPSCAIANVERLPMERRKVGGFLTDGIAQLATFEPFNDVLAMVDARGNLAAFLSNLTETFARVYINIAKGIGGAIAFIHCVTGSRAVRNLSRYIDDSTARLAARYAWQASAGLYAAFGIAAPSHEEPSSSLSIDELIDRALANADEHAIKFTEACVHEHALNPKPVYLAAAAHALEVLPPLT
jgi:questin oxidase-like protein